MTLVVGGNCFNGFICIADIQATIKYKEGRELHFNCVNKIHKVFDNLCVAFSGDIRSGLLIIEDLKIYLNKYINENEYFDLDGQSAILVKYLKKTYKKINFNSKPFLEFMFLWTAQEGDNSQFRPFCMKFKSPEFRMNSTPQLGVASSGSGVNNEYFHAIASFLSGTKYQTNVYEKLFQEHLEGPRIWTVQKFKTLFFNEATEVNFSGVSKTFISFESTIDYGNIFPEWAHTMLAQICNELGVKRINVKTKNDDLNLLKIEFEEVISRANMLNVMSPKKYEDIRSRLAAITRSANAESICVLPQIITDIRINADETIHAQPLISTWRDMVHFLKSENININACTANA